jgi:hypothetical protein
MVLWFVEPADPGYELLLGSGGFLVGCETRWRNRSREATRLSTKVHL